MARRNDANGGKRPDRTPSLRSAQDRRSARKTENEQAQRAAAVSRQFSSVHHGESRNTSRLDSNPNRPASRNTSRLSGDRSSSRSSTRNTSRLAEDRRAANPSRSSAQKRSSSSNRRPTRSAGVSAQAYSRENASKRYKARNSSSGAGASGNKRKILMGVGAVVLVALIAFGVAFGLWYARVSGNISSSEDVDLASEVANEPYYVLLLGGDDRGDEATAEDAGNRTDSIMVARVDEQEQTVHLLSIPRDTRVYIPGKEGYGKINSAYEYGGMQSTVDIVQDILGIKISYFAIIYFDGFEQLVDKLGGVTVEVPEGTYYAGTWVPAGDAVEINGEEALVLARCRHGYPEDQGAYASGDYQRAINQRNLIKAIAHKVLEQDVTEYPSLIEGLSECVETNMSVTKLISLASTMKGMDTDNMDAKSIPVAGVAAGGESACAIYEDIFQVLQPNFVEGRDIMYGMDNYNWYCINHDMTGHCTDGPYYCYTYYRDVYGEFLSSETDTASDASSGQTSS